MRRPTETSERLVAGASMISIACGSALALALLPKDPAGDGALVTASSAMAFGLLGGMAVDVVQRGWRAALRAQHLLMLALIYFILLDLIQQLYPVKASEDAVRGAFLAIGLFAGAVVLGSSLPWWPLPRTVLDLASREYSVRGLILALLLFFALGMSNFVLASDFSPETMRRGLLAPRFGAPWSRRALGGWDAFLDFMTYFGYLLPAWTVLIALRVGKWLDWTVAGSCVLSLIFSAFVVQGGGRRILGVMVGAAVVTWLCDQSHVIRARRVFAVAAALATTIVFMDVMLATRGRGFGELSWELHEFQSVRVDDNFLRIVQIIEAVPADHPHVGFQWLWYTVVRPVPRVLWPDKPLDPGFSLAQYLGHPGVSLTSSVIGESYFAFGWIGVLVAGLFFGGLARPWSELLDRPSLPSGNALYAFGLMALLLAIRSVIELILMTYPLACWLFVDRFLLRRTRAVTSELPALPGTVPHGS